MYCMDKKMSLEINEKNITLNFGVNAFYEYYKEDSGHDLVKDPKMVLLDTASIELFNIIQSMIWGAYRAELYVTKAIKGEISREDVKYFVMTGDDTLASDLAHKLWSCRLSMSVDEFKELLRKSREATAALAETDPKP